MSNSKFNLIFHEVELVTQRKNFYKNFRVSNSKCDVILRNSVLQLDFVTREFRTSFWELLYLIICYFSLQKCYLKNVSVNLRKSEGPILGVRTIALEEICPPNNCPWIIAPQAFAPWIIVPGKNCPRINTRWIISP